LRHIEQNFPQVQVDIEMNSLEDAYVKIAEDEIKAKEGELGNNSIENPVANSADAGEMSRYLDTLGNPSVCGQILALAIRRWIVFLREPRQWFMLIAPFINVISSLMILYAFIAVATPDDSDVSSYKILQGLTAFLFPFLLMYGFTTTAGIYMITPISDRESRLRQVLHITGLKPFSYYLGTLIADYSLFMVSQLIFVVFALLADINTYSEQMVSFILIMSSFGLSMISFTYLFSNMFNDNNSAFRCMTVVYLILGLVAPGLVISIAGVISESGSVTIFLNGLFFCLDPFFTFYYANWSLVFMFFFPEEEIPVTRAINSDPITSSAVMVGQAVLYFLMAVFFDSRSSNAFMRPSGNMGQGAP